MLTESKAQSHSHVFVHTHVPVPAPAAGEFCSREQHLEEFKCTFSITNFPCSQKAVKNTEPEQAGPERIPVQTPNDLRE